MDSSILFLVAIILAYAIARFSGLSVYKLLPAWWPQGEIVQPNFRFKNVWLGLSGILGMLIVGESYQHGYLIPEPADHLGAACVWILNNLLIYCPVFAVILVCRQSTNTAFLAVRQIACKVVFGIGAALVAILLIYLIVPTSQDYLEVLVQSVSQHRLKHFPAMFLVGVAIAFCFVRLSRTIGLRWAILIPSILFGLSHIPLWSESGNGITVGRYVLVTSGVTALILYATNRSKDII